MVSSELTTTVMRRAPIVLDEADWAIGEDLTALHDEAAEWRDALATYKGASPGTELWALAHAIVMAVSVAMGVAPEERRTHGAYQERVGEARVAWQRVDGMHYGAEWQQG